MAIVYLQGNEQMALGFFKARLEVEGDPAAREELRVAIEVLKGRVATRGQSFATGSDETITLT